MTVITMDHDGSVILCPDGDLSNGLVNLRPTSEGKEIMPFYWQTQEEYEKNQAEAA